MGRLTPRGNAPAWAAASSLAVERLEGRMLATVFVVTSTADAGPGSLRQAILDSNKAAGRDEIHFAIGSGPQTIAPLTALPGIGGPAVLDATTQPGFAGKPLIELTGRRLTTTSPVTGLSVTAGDSVVRGFVINGFSGNGIRLLSSGGNVVAGNYVGTDASGAAPSPNAGQGVFVQSRGNLIGGSLAADRNVISGNVKNGIQLYTSGASGNTIRGNYVGTDAAGRSAVPNGQCGVGIDGAPDNLVGGAAPSSRNVISGNAADGVLIAAAGATRNRVWGNFIGTDASGTAKVGNGLYGVEVSQPNNAVGASVRGARNVISGNAKSGVVLYLATATGNRVQGNYIGTDASGRFDLGNAGRGVDITHGPSGNVIGGAGLLGRNVISGNDGGGVGVYADATRNRIEANYLGTDASGSRAVRNGGLGAIVVISTAGTGNVIGGNLISSGSLAVSVAGAALGTVVEGNRVATVLG